ncbi:MAG: bifunctional folylpolyglutamate synthase/dihydrofolate synthase [Verrucomicrobiota bacterium]|nr:bifunctional folylpolyglutamate synthase/dihydrofolate synthase [Verrucomicrobiota bacterium]
MMYKEALAWLFGTQRFGIKLGLENIRRLLGALDVPAPEQRIVHVAGTNGKGSVCAMIDSIARVEGYRTGLFTSPHLVTFCERIQVGGEPVSETAVASSLTSIHGIIREWNPHPTFFEIATALGLQHFHAQRCELIVLETGLGGRLDATNAVTPVVSVITPIDYDHQRWLGSTLAEIAFEKAGIIKPGVPVVSSAQEPVVEKVLRARANDCKAAIRFVIEEYAEGAIGLAGAHQARNAALAIAALSSAQVGVTPDAIARGLAEIRWPARFQRWNEGIVIDGAHNAAGARVVAETWRQIFGAEKAALVFGVLRDKDIAAVYRELSGLTALVVLPRFTGERVVPPEEVAVIVATVSPQIRCHITHSCSEALKIAQRTPHRVLVAGSLHLAGEVIAHLRGRPAAFEECAQ